MSQECTCETPSFEVPVLGIKLTLPENIFPAPGPSGEGFQTWESGWFTIAASKAYTFEHKLNLATPWLVIPRLVFKVIAPQNGWQAGDIVFADGQNYVGATANTEMGWLINLKKDDALVTFGNDSFLAATMKTGGFGALYKSNVEAKLLISY
ncbi:hypothetical protein [Desulfovibrio cuneatus]|uniref:hypothetical protein n=1 Tax=Desulfovibrio cuneatus TaxID=159728 RepID=UPI0004828378|nr:hypothetical protein [Desulfovibrio cuneatus]